jgi:anti-anti-sigma regulatory factor
MGEIQVADRGSREIVVFLSGDIDDAMTGELQAAVDDVARLERLSQLSHAVVDMHAVTSLGRAGVAFLRELQGRGARAGFEVSFSNLNSTAHRALDEAGWTFVEGSAHGP